MPVEMEFHWLIRLTLYCLRHFKSTGIGNDLVKKVKTDFIFFLAHIPKTHGKLWLIQMSKYLLNNQSVAKNDEFVGKAIFGS